MPKRKLKVKDDDTPKLKQKRSLTGLNKDNQLFHFTESDEDSESDSDENIEWEDAELDENVSIQIDKDKFGRSANKLLPTKRKLKHYKRLKYGLHIAEMPFLLHTLKRRAQWIEDTRLNRRLKRSVPKLIIKKFQLWSENKLNIDSTKSNYKELYGHKFEILLRGLIFWFRDHYKINSNGFRQNFLRFHYLIQYMQSKKKSNMYHRILENQQELYGSRPTNTTFKDMAKKKMSTRDILVLFFIIILKNIIPKEKIHKLVLCFALPLTDFNLSPTNAKLQLEKGMGYIQNRFDSDLIFPNFWIELYMNDDKQHVYVIDPVVHLKDENIISKHSIEDYIPNFEPDIKLSSNLKQNFRYVVGFNIATKNIHDLTGRYISNSAYTYFDKSYTSMSKSMNVKSTRYYFYCLNMINRIPLFKAHFDRMKRIATNNTKVCQKYSDLKSSENFISKSLLKYNQCLKKDTIYVGKIKYTDIETNKKINENVYWKDSILHLRSKHQWLMKGRSIKSNETPINTKKYLSLKSRREQSLDKFTVKELYSIEQTEPTPKLPSTYINQEGMECEIHSVNFYKNEHGNVEILDDSIVPDGFRLIKITHTLKSIISIYNSKYKKLDIAIAQSNRIQYIDVVSGFNFREKPGYAVPVVKHIMVNQLDYTKITNLVVQHRNISGLADWSELLNKLLLIRKLNQKYGEVNQK